MKYILLTINFIHHCYLGLAALPAPADVRIESLNFEHILRWTPGQGTPPGTAYRVNYSCGGKRFRLEPSFLNSSATMLNLTDTFKKPKEHCAVQVRALNGARKSPWSSVLFRPYTDTVLGPPQVSVTGHRDRLLLNITFPRGKAKETIEKIYHKLDFSIFWKKAGESQVQRDTATRNEHFINHLHPGVEYCVRAQAEIIENKNVLSSDWTCHFTSPPPLNPVPTALASVSVILLLGSCVVLPGLIYTGFICSVNPRPPNALGSVVQSYFLNVVATVPDRVSVIPEPKGIGGVAGGRAQDDDEDEEEEEEEDGGNGGYESRAAGSSGATRSSSSGTVAPLTTDTSLSEDSGNSRTSSTRTGHPVECGDPFTVGMSCQSETAITGPSLSQPTPEDEEQEEEEGGEGEGEGEEGRCPDINLLSVTLGEQVEEEEEVGGEEGWAAAVQPTDHVGECQPLISVETGEGSRLSELASSQTDNPALSYSPCSSNQSERWKIHSCYLQMHSVESREIDTLGALEEGPEDEEVEEEEEDDEEFSSYLRH